MDIQLYILTEYDNERAVGEKLLRAFMTRKAAIAAKKALETKRRLQTKSGRDFPEFYEPRYFYRIATCKLLKVAAFKFLKDAL